MARPAAAPDALPLVDRLMHTALARGASDLHIEPVTGGYEIRLRLDGLLHTEQTVDTATGRTAVSRLMVMAQLLTYRQDIPQEGRLQFTPPGAQAPIEARVAVMPTKRGLRVALRLPTDSGPPRDLEALGLPQEVLTAMQRFARGDSGLLLVTGPAGAGKTTTLHALLAHIVQTQPGLSVVALEDPVERDLPGVTQIEVSPFGELTYERALRSILRQDPQVLMLGEIRDAATATLAMQAALSGHRLLSTFHAATPGGAIARLLEMGIEPYQITSAVALIVTQRLLRQARPAGGFQGRIPIAEAAACHPALRQAILARADAGALQAAAQTASGYRTLAQAGQRLVDAGQTTAEEVRRVLGETTDD